jgi:hypothetical protein
LALVFDDVDVSMVRGPFHTNFWLWAVAASGVFVALGFFDPSGGMTKGENLSFWRLFVVLVPLGRYDFLGVYALLLTGPRSCWAGWARHLLSSSGRPCAVNTRLGQRPGQWGQSSVTPES